MHRRAADASDASAVRTAPHAQAPPSAVHVHRYDVDGEPPESPAEAVASELEGRLVPLATGLLRLRLLHDALGSVEEHLMKDVRGLCMGMGMGRAACACASRLPRCRGEMAHAAATPPQVRALVKRRLQEMLLAREASGGADGGGAEAAAPSAELPAGAPSAEPPAAARTTQPVMTQLRELTMEGFDEVAASPDRDPNEPKGALASTDEPRLRPHMSPI